MERFANDAATVAVVAAWLAPLLLIAVYSFAAPWWAKGNTVGRTLVTVKAAVSLALLPPMVHRLDGSAAPPSAMFTLFQTVTWGVLTVVLLRMIWVILHIQVTAARQRGDGKGA